MFVSEYLPASFDDTCEMIERLVSSAPRLWREDELFGIRIDDRLHMVADGVARIRVEYTGDGPGGAPASAELRVLRVESGHPALTELLLIVPQDQSPERFRAILELILAKTEAHASAVAGLAAGITRP
jgi:hypothetical protein